MLNKKFLVKTRLRSLLVVAMTIAMVVATQARGTQEQEDTLGDKIKRLFTGPSPTPHKPHKKLPVQKKAAPKLSESPSPSPSTAPTETPWPTPPPTVTISPEASALPSATSYLETAPTAAPAVAATSAPQALDAEPQYFEPVRPISPGPRARPRSTRAPRTPTPSPVAKPSPSPTVTPSSSPTITPSPLPVAKKTRTPSATISAAEISGYDSYPPEVRKIVDLGLSLTTEKLSYKINSADPANGGMDSSGFVHYVLSKSGIKDVPRDAREQYIWVRKAGKFQAVLAQRDDSFELDALKPGDLLFWASPYSGGREPDITQTMIYLGREKATNQRVMLGASERRTYKGQARFGVSVFDFKVGRAAPKSDKEPGPVFVGYGSVPGPATE